jgi:hypothetical protein
MIDVKGLAMSGVEISDAELLILRTVQDLGLKLLVMFIEESHSRCAAEGRPLDSTGAIAASKGTSTVQFQSIFGLVEICRQKFHSFTDGSIFPLDARLNLPARQESFLLQKWLAGRSSTEDYRESVSLLNEILGLDISPMQSHRIAQEAGAVVDAYYSQCAPPDPDGEGSFLCAQFDGKGVPIIESERGGPVEASEPRLMKGQKRGTKKMATVSVTFSFNPAARTAGEVVDGLHGKRTEEEAMAYKEMARATGERPREAKNIHRRAMLGDQQGGISYGIANLAARDPSGTKPIIVLVDGGVGLEQAIRAGLEAAGMGHRLEAMVLDFIHVTEYVWKAANAILGEKHLGRTPWVEKQLLKILDGKVEEVTASLRRACKAEKLSKAQSEAVQKSATYFENQKHKMAYDIYLKEGYPITTGLVEGTCGALVKERMEGSGMRWGIQGAQNILDLRAAKINGDLDLLFHKIQDDNRKSLYDYAA